MFNKRLSNLSALFVLTISTSTSMAHINIATENALVLGENAREYKEGTSAYLNLNISHDCTNEAGRHFPTTGVTLLMPNGTNVPGTYTSDRSGNQYGANAVMGIKQRVNHTFRRNIVKKGSVGTYYGHGEKTEDVRVLKWLRGKVDNDHYENLEFKVSFPKINPESCIAKLKVYFPSVQYCKRGYKTAWINTADSKYGEGNARTRVTDTYAAYATVVRTSELPKNCEDSAEEIKVMPSIEDINRYLSR